MNDEAALLAAIAANPDDDTVRLAYADFLDEQGGEVNAARAEFIRLHIRAARPDSDAPEAVEVRRRLGQLLCLWDLIWVKEMPEGFRYLSGYRRGFAYRAAALASAVPAAGDDPRLLLIEEFELDLDAPPSRIRQVIPDRLFSRLVTLRVKSPPGMGLGDVRMLAESEFPRLESLSLERVTIGDLGIKAICDSGAFPRLRRLNLDQNDITDEGGRTLLQSDLIGRLVHIWIGGQPLSNEVRTQLHDRVRR